jgi:hypothetical protein
MAGWRLFRLGLLGSFMLRAPGWLVDICGGLA